jgi:hypothetical protein
MASQVYQFRITLRGIEPPIWRLIEVPTRYDFWQLHVAIQDAMGWTDSHLHVFRPGPPGPKRIQIGIPDDNFAGDDLVVPGWKHKIQEFLADVGDATEYEYDFGDSWEHDVRLEALLPRVKGRKYPRCVSGERACPPEDCGGVHGYKRLLEVLFDPQHPEFESTLTWLGPEFSPEAFDPAAVRFDDPRGRWKTAFLENDSR